jgi:hypothetical protein
MKLSKASILSGFKKIMNAILILSGIGLVGYGAWQIYPPAAYIVVGIAVFWMGLPER